MKHRPNARWYLEHAQALRRLGYEVRYTPTRKALKKGHYKAAVSRLWNDKAHFYQGERYELIRFRTPASRRKWEAIASPEQIFPAGVMIQRPLGMKKGEYRWRLNQKAGTATITSKDGRIHDIFIRLDMVALADDSKAALEEALTGQRRPKQLLLTVNGHDVGTREEGFTDLEAFNRYLEQELIPHLYDAKFDFDKWGHGIFGLKLVYTGKKGAKFNFKTGSIFDANSKRVLGRKQFLNRGLFAPKHGNRKGT